MMRPFLEILLLTLSFVVKIVKGVLCGFNPVFKNLVSNKLRVLFY